MCFPRFRAQAHCELCATCGRISLAPHIQWAHSTETDTLPVTEGLSHMHRFAEKKNFVVFSLEIKRKDFFKTFGGPYDSPNLSRLADRSLTFSKMFAAAPSTAMSLRSMLEGRDSHSFDLYSNEMQRFEGNLFSEMKARGYRTFFVMSETIKNGYADDVHHPADAERIVIPDAEHSTTAIAKKVIELQQSCTEPFVIFAHTSPLVPCDDSAKPVWRNEIEKYVHEDDVAIGILLDNLDLDDTRLIVCSDHGCAMGEHSHIFRHAYFVYDTILSVPCLITDDKPKDLNEVYSLTQLKGVVTDGVIDAPPRIFCHTQHPHQKHRVSMVREEDWKYVAHYNWQTAVTGLQEELYDLGADPGEHRNLLHDIARHPLRYGFNYESIRARNAFFSYDENLLRERTRHFRSFIAAIWSAGLIESLERQGFMSQAAELRAKLEVCTPVEQLAVCGTVLNSLHPDDPSYGKKDKVPPPGSNIPYDFPGLPRNQNCLNFLSFDGEDLSRLFS